MTYQPGDPRYTKYKKAEYRRNKEYYLKWSRERYRKRREWLDALKKNPCADCKQSFPPCCMDFDHDPQHQKLGGIGQLYSFSAGLDMLLVEIAKCQLVCANCHRIRTHKRSSKKYLEVL